VINLADNLAYTETVHTKHGTDREYRILTFKEQVKWHRSKLSQTIHILSGTGWRLKQSKNPTIELEVGKDYQLVPKGECRLIKGREHLVIRIEELFQPSPKNPIL
tara:strand:+ start:854 stop:1168 length:315 start_codon:yes stop_codon:yes gene_type:complete